MELTQKQQTYFDRIQNTKLKELLKASYTFCTMTQKERDEFLVWASVVHSDQNAEQELIQAFQEEAEERKMLFSDPAYADPAGEDKQKQEELLFNQGTEFEANLKKAKKYVLMEKEIDSQTEDKAKLSQLEAKLKQT